MYSSFISIFSSLIHLCKFKYNHNHSVIIIKTGGAISISFFWCILTSCKGPTNVLLEKSKEDSSHVGSCQLGLIFAVGVTLANSRNVKNLWTGTMTSGEITWNVFLSVTSLKRQE